MKAALGFKAHSGWAALVLLGRGAKGIELLERRRVELVEEATQRAKQPYHAAEALDPEAAEALVRRGIEGARHAALKALRSLLSERDIAACGVLLPGPMPAWSTAQILAVHIRMHQAEGHLFPAALCAAAEACGLPLLRLREKALDPRDCAIKSPGPPWARDQKLASLAALQALSLH